MKKILLMGALCLTLGACDQQDSHSRSSMSSGTPTGSDSKMDANMSLNQLENETDHMVTERVRAAINADGVMAVSAKNVRFSTKDGIVTLQGNVVDAREKEMIGKKVSNVSGVLNVNNQIEIAPDKF